MIKETVKEEIPKVDEPDQQISAPVEAAKTAPADHKPSPAAST